ncbi:MAG: sigma-70 family RNA polymerase sigma factor [Lachnospiraceae bacterium]|nr:sigma-70 family RNA polymerase sigma factor [Lachnospiraceae bacterium]
MNQEEQKLIKKLKRFPNKGMPQIIDAYMPAVKSICKHLLWGLSEDIVDDAVQETFIKLWTFVKSDKVITGSLKGLLYQIARNTCFDLMRENKGILADKMISEDVYTVENILVDSGANIEEEFARRYNFNLVHEVIEAMEEPDRRIFILRYFYNYKTREIALDVGLPEDNVESRIRRNRKKLKEELMKGGVFYEE